MSWLILLRCCCFWSRTKPETSKIVEIDIIDTSNHAMTNVSPLFRKVICFGANKICGTDREFCICLGINSVLFFIPPILQYNDTKYNKYVAWITRTNITCYQDRWREAKDVHLWSQQSLIWGMDDNQEIIQFWSNYSIGEKAE